MLCFFANYKKTILFQKMCSFFGGGGGQGRGWQVCWIIKNVLDKHDLVVGQIGLHSNVQEIFLDVIFYRKFKKLLSKIAFLF